MDPVQSFTETRAALKIQRAMKIRYGSSQFKKQMNKRTDAGLVGVVHTTDAMRGGHAAKSGGDRTDRVLKRISVHDHRRNRGASLGQGLHPRIKAILDADEFNPDAFVSPEVAELFNAVHESERETALVLWSEVSDWNVPLDTAAIERRLELMRRPAKKPQPLTTGRRGSGGYLKKGSRPATATAAGRGVAAARALRRPSTAPPRVRQQGLSLRVLLRAVVACTRMTRHADVADVGFFLTRGVA